MRAVEVSDDRPSPQELREAADIAQANAREAERESQRWAAMAAGLRHRARVIETKQAKEQRGK